VALTLHPLGFTSSAARPHHATLSPPEEVLERDFFMSAPEALAFGLVDEVIEARPPAEAEALAQAAADGAAAGAAIF
jgi:enoyl-CoA hydratase/carnithine racemase